MINDTHDFAKLPSREEMTGLIAQIKLFQKLKELQFIPFPTALIRKGHFIERCRINKAGEVFISENELSYRTDFENIKTYGRANTIGDPLFYGSFESDMIGDPRLVNLMETSEIFRNLEHYGESRENFVMTGVNGG